MKRDILYVDDEMDNLVVFEATFEDDFNVVTANGGQEALEILQRQSFPVVVADQRMPFMTGAELFEQMRSRYPHTKRVMLTGYADSHAMLDAINQGQVYYFIKKPWDRDLVFSILVRAIESYDLSLNNMALTDRLVANDRCATLGRSAARIAHEMGNQLCVLPLLELIEDKYREHEDLIKMASIARTTHERLVELVNEVKSFVRFRHDDQVRQPLQLSDLVHELVEFLRFDRSLPMDRLSVQLVSDATVRGNKVNLQQVLVNLLKNAAHAIRDRFDGHIELIVSCSESEAELIVADNGHGMTPEVQQRIWETFFTTKGTEGTGLGLDVVKSIVEAHHGQIECQSAPCAGAKFTIRLPLAEAAGSAETELAGPHRLEAVAV
jgi:two-component system sensor histidine kinase/response regulator